MQARVTGRGESVPNNSKFCEKLKNVQTSIAKDEIKNTGENYEEVGKKHNKNSNFKKLVGARQ